MTTGVGQVTWGAALRWHTIKGGGWLTTIRLGYWNPPGPNRSASMRRQACLSERAFMNMWCWVKGTEGARWLQGNSTFCNELTSLATKVLGVELVDEGSLLLV